MGTRDDEEKIIKELNPELFNNSETHDDEDEGSLSEDEWSDDEWDELEGKSEYYYDEYGEEIPKYYSGIQNTKTDPTVIYEDEYEKITSTDPELLKKKSLIHAQEQKEKDRKDNINAILIILMLFFIGFLGAILFPNGGCNPDIDDCYGRYRGRR